MGIRKLPPLKALRAFEAAARHGNFSRAADELYVTHAAISHQVKALEAEAGVALFHRTGRAVELTDAGRALLPQLTLAFDRIADAWAQVRGETGGPVTVSVEPSFAARWLVLRLGRFSRAHADIQLRLVRRLKLPTSSARTSISVFATGWATGKGLFAKGYSRRRSIRSARRISRNGRVISGGR